MSPKVKRLFLKYHGTLTSKLASQFGINRASLDYLVKKGEITKDYPGVYILKGDFPDEYFWRSNIYKGVYSHETVLFLYGYTNATPTTFDMTFKNGYHSPNLDKYFITAHYTNKWALGLSEMKIYTGNSVSIYNREITLCDIFRLNYPIDIWLRNEALQNYLKDPQRNLARLSSYQKELKISDKLTELIGVLNQ
ncbi:type IV toxin-antitoxin system AbiEi family antitoxin domain-containing protein [Bombilactobacillus bombi]|uniref:type IV toxin-antitoxin system AbiEi family antitoxin domain-containing protein n=1 Tax=Bombilactobacillus bombi TaxID=1303590 RepID=UPI0015E5DB4F|nr:type IV toxin-antitoxin system AbiEi family antitoxin domain-containing protein [Bombilactobacillus bombi]MBA1434315.1 hypothetical protein [Bombilactobacillus bombi]